MKRILAADRLFDGTTLHDDKVIVIENGKIISVENNQNISDKTEDYERINYYGCTILPGLIDSHVHTIMPGNGVDPVVYSAEPDEILFHVGAMNLRRALKAGVTTVADFGSKGDITYKLRQSQKAGYVTGSKLVVCGRAIMPTGGHGSRWGGEVDGADNLRAAVRTLVKSGSDFIKVMATGSTNNARRVTYTAYTDPELRVIIDTAHNFGLKVAAHATTTVAIETLVNHGVDIIAHCQFFGPEGSYGFDLSVAEKIRDGHIYVNPTLEINRVLRSEHVRSRMSDSQKNALESWNRTYPAFEESMRQMNELGIPLLAGSDAGWGWLEFGKFSQELDAMVSAGLSCSKALEGATSLNARAFLLDDVGSIQPGKTADLLVVNGDPTKEINDLRDVVEVWLDGIPVSDLLDD